MGLPGSTLTLAPPHFSLSQPSTQHPVPIHHRPSRVSSNISRTALVITAKLSLDIHSHEYIFLSPRPRPGGGTPQSMAFLVSLTGRDPKAATSASQYSNRAGHRDHDLGPHWRILQLLGDGKWMEYVPIGTPTEVELTSTTVLSAFVVAWNHEPERSLSHHAHNLRVADWKPGHLFGLDIDHRQPDSQRHPSDCHRYHCHLFGRRERAVGIRRWRWSPGHFSSSCVLRRGRRGSLWASLVI